jgi:pimeloyl-ACP methyl ester carboxylesterase
MPTRRQLMASFALTLPLATCTGVSRMIIDEPALPGAEDDFVVVDGVPIHYVRLGSGPPVVLIHGASGNLREWTFRAAPKLAERYTIIAFDRPGHGLSGWPGEAGVTLSLQAALLRKALAQLGISRAVLIGHSYGGSVALAWAIDAPQSVSGLMLLGAPSQVWPGGLALSTDLLAAPVLGPALAYALPKLVTESFATNAAGSVFAPQQAPEGYVEHLGLGLVLQPQSLRINALQLTALKEQIRAMVPHYPELGMPVEILHGTADTTVGLDIHSVPLAAQVPNARLTVLEGVGHMIHHVAFLEVEAALDRLQQP